MKQTNRERDETVKRETKRRRWCLALLCVLPISIGAAYAASAPSARQSFRRLQLFARVLTHLERQYIEPVDKDTLIIGAIKGMVETLDPHSSLLVPEEFEIFEADTRGQFGGVGLEVGIRKGKIIVITPIEGSPADKAGIEPGDQLIAIDNISTRDMNIEEAVKLMRGVPGTEVKTTFDRPGVDTPVNVVLKRAIIEVKSVRAELIAPGFPWLQVRVFQDGTTGEIKSAIKRLTPKGSGLKGVLLDLRRNPGGVLQEAVKLSDLFIASGTILSTRGRNDKTLEVFQAKRRGTVDDVPVVVLIDGTSASAAEIVAGALQDHGRALLVGGRSFGKGSVQSLIDVGDGFGLKITIARYFTPNGRSIQAEGIVPDVLVESKLPPVPDEETRMISQMPSEKDLPGHLQAKEDKAQLKGLREIADYQLRIAAQLLVGLASQAKSLSDK